jgi:hypothetical protein
MDISDLKDQSDIPEVQVVADYWDTTEAKGILAVEAL